MKRKPIIQTLLVLVIVLLTSCKEKKVEIEKRFPFTEQEMLKSKGLTGALLDYAIFDTTKIDFVKSAICDSLKGKHDFVFTRIETIINDSSYFMFYFHERISGYSDDFQLVYLDVNNLDSLYLYSSEIKYHVNDFDKMVDKISLYKNWSITDIIKHKKVGKYYVPNIWFFVDFNSMDCADGFIEKAIEVDRKIKSLLNAYVKKKLPDEQLLIEPRIELRVNDDF